MKLFHVERLIKSTFVDNNYENFKKIADTLKCLDEKYHIVADHFIVILKKLHTDGVKKNATKQP